MNVQKQNQQISDEIQKQKEKIEKDKWYLNQQQKALQQLELDNQLVRQDIVTYSSYYAEHADLNRTIPQFIAQINKRQKQLEPKKELDDAINDEFVNNLSRLYTRITDVQKAGKEQRPNTRIILGFAHMVVESVKAMHSNADFISEQYHYKQRYQDFHKFFVSRDTDEF